MPVLPPGSSTPKDYYASDLVLDAAIEIGIVSPGNEDNFPSEQANWIFRKLNYMLDIWAAKKAFVLNNNFQVFQLVPGLSPILIGPTGTAPIGMPDDLNWVLPQRPIAIESAALLLNDSTEEVDCNINVRDDQWWAALQTKKITSTVPTDLYYSASWENGECNFWPVQNTSRNVRLQLREVLLQYNSITDPIGGPNTTKATLAPSYRAAMMHTLAEMIAPSFKVEVTPALQKAAVEARKAVFGNNNLAARVATRDYGVPRGSRSGGQWNYGFGGPPGMGPR